MWLCLLLVIKANFEVHIMSQYFELHIQQMIVYKGTWNSNINTDKNESSCPWKMVVLLQLSLCLWIQRLFILPQKLKKYFPLFGLVCNLSNIYSGQGFTVSLSVLFKWPEIKKITLSKASMTLHIKISNKVNAFQ